MSDITTLDLRKHVRRRHFKLAFSYTAWAVIFSFLPIWFSFLIALTRENWWNSFVFEKFYINGDFAIVSAGALSSVILVLFKRRSSYPFYEVTWGLVILCMMVCVLVWTQCNVILAGEKLNSKAIFIFSFILVMLTYLINAFSVLCDECIGDIDLSDVRNEGQRALAEKFGKTGA